MAEGRRWRGLLRFNLAAMMFVTLCVCAYLGSYRYGERAGAKQQYDESYFIRVYSLADLLIETPGDDERDKQAAAIAENMKSTVAPASWTSPDMQHGEIQVFPRNGSLIVGQHGAVHDQIAAAIDNLRDDAHSQHVEAAVKGIESLSAKRHDPIVLASFTSQDSLHSEAIEQRYESVIQGIEKHWGSPRFAGECTEVGFPAWSVAQKIAIWSSNGGEAYIAIQELPQLGRVLLTGWRSRD
jgi:uncharacterized membrane-anchored protein